MDYCKNKIDIYIDRLDSDHTLYFTEMWIWGNFYKLG